MASYDYRISLSDVAEGEAAQPRHDVRVSTSYVKVRRTYRIALEKNLQPQGGFRNYGYVQQ